MALLPDTLRQVDASRALLAAGAFAIGLAAGWAAPSHLPAVAALLVIVAAANGYSKAYSP
jgi:hypothetical protein